MRLRHLETLGGLVTTIIVGLLTASVLAAPAPNETKPAISEEASAALLRMGQALSAKQFSLQARTIRVYTDAGGQPLHIFHTVKVTAQRPNHVLAEVTGADGSEKLLHDGKRLPVFSAQKNKYASISVPDGTTIYRVLKEAVGSFGIDFPARRFS